MKANISAPKRLFTFLLGLLIVAPLGAQQESAFGSHESTESALIGIFYDLKQSQDRKPIQVNDPTYVAALDEFVSDGMDESYLNTYFRAGLPLYATQLYIPKMNANEAPKAFRVQDVVQPRYWIIHYKGQISPPEDGTYRFVGIADDILTVAINRQIVLVGNRYSSVFSNLGWKSAVKDATPPAFNKSAIYGDWMELKADELVDIDIIVGEKPGGHFEAILAYQKQGVTYPRNDDGRILLPLFQLAPQEIKSPHFLKDQPYWRAVP